MKLYRAASTEDPYLGQWSCWTETEEAAEAYKDNPGYGGPIVYVADLEPEYVLDLTGSNAFRDLADSLYDGDEADAAYMDWMGSGYSYIYDVWENRPKVADMMSSQYSWVKYIDDYPEGSITWVSLETEPISARPYQ